MSKVESFTLEMRGFTQSPRRIWVYLPDSYDTKQDHLFDVLYMFDGHNLFFDDVATYGKSWGIKDYLDRTKLDLVVVGQDCNHEGNKRIEEYCPFPSEPVIGWEIETYCGNRTADWFVNTLKPEIEKRYHVCADRNHIGIGGSSMGGLMSDYMAAAHSDTFSKFASISPATLFCRKDMLNLIQNSSISENTRIYRSVGSEEGRGDTDSRLQMLDMMLEFSNAFIDQGCIVHNKLGVGLDHSEAAWETLVPEFLQFLYPHLY